MPSINIDLDFFTHPKAVRLTKILGPNSTENLIRLWCHVGKHYPDTGGTTEWSTDEVEADAGWMGDRGLFVDCLMSLKLLHQWGNGYRIHDWEDHAGHLKRYREKAKKAINARWSRNKQKPDTPSILQEYSKNTCSNTNAVQYKTTISNDFLDHEPTCVEINEASFSPECGEVYSYWVEAKKKAGLKTLTAKEKPEAARIAAHIKRGSFAMVDIKAAIDAVMADEKSRSKYGLGGVLRNINSLVNQKHAEANPAKAERFGTRLSDILRQSGMEQHDG